ncbi:MAG: isoprenylcysteine carboxylmethyltransferase family protein [Rhodothermales bacterium]|nr:isoprenylcysteine carboxylmethyltransferase family protein [Rhodothermales bacterium]
MTTQLLFLGLVLALAAQRLFELRLSARNEATLKARGAREAGAGHFGAMRLLHTLWFVAMVAEVFLLDRPFVPALAAVGGVGLVVGQALRYAAIRTLGERWTVRVLVLPGAPPVSGGIYRWIRHPNYLGVILEIAAVPILHTAWVTSVSFSLLNAVLLRTRICAEERALEAAGDYGGVLPADRFLPLGHTGTD